MACVTAEIWLLPFFIGPEAAAPGLCLLPSAPFSQSDLLSDPSAVKREKKRKSRPTYVRGSSRLFYSFMCQGRVGKVEVVDGSGGTGVFKNAARPFNRQNTTYSKNHFDLFQAGSIRKVFRLVT